jgi:succinate-semialdehyde dehydrogenase/glutarate-semialdehyde dehydrogenase
MKRLSLELGGHAPALVFAGADLEETAARIVASRFRHAGQTCISVQRVFAEEEIADRLLKSLLTRIAGLRLGNGLSDTTDLGPLISEEALARVEAHVEDAVQKGATVRIGGARERLPAPDCGHFYQPTLLDEVNQKMRIMREEIFGPVLAFARFRREDEAIAKANSTRFGLAAYVFTNDLNRAGRVTQQLHFGAVGVNDTRIVAPQLPFGGWKESGLGKENGAEGFETYLETKSVIRRLA